MQIYAFDSQDVLVFADLAKKHQNYLCIECGSTVRLRKGVHRKAHFYHLQPNRACRLHEKGMKHLMLQHYLKNILPEEEAELECRFPSIGRIADVAWHAKHIIYEIQCSPISVEEVQARNKGYASIGYQVVWIFHDDRYNQERLSAVEDFLYSKPHYFSNMNEEGEGKIYDQFSYVLNGRRKRRLPIFCIDLSVPKFLKKPKWRVLKRLPLFVRKRIKSWPLMFAGDMLDSCLDFCESRTVFKKDEYLTQEVKKVFMEGLETLSVLSQIKSVLSLFFQRLHMSYESLINLILEKACR